LAGFQVTLIGRFWVTPEAFDPAEWKHIRGDVEKALLSGAPKVGREYSFCTFRATGWWRGTRSGVQIIQPPEDAPRAGLEGADHPFILEFPLKEVPFKRSRIRGGFAYTAS
jgi:hypothetical protein